MSRRRWKIKMTGFPDKTKITGVGDVPLWKDRAHRLPKGDYNCGEGDEDTHILNGADATTYRVEKREFELAIDRGAIEKVMPRQSAESKKARSIRPDPTTNPNAKEYRVVDIEQNEPRQGSEYEAGTITPAGKGKYCAIAAQMADAQQGQPPVQMKHGWFPTIREAADSFPEGFLPYVSFDEIKAWRAMLDGMGGLR
jgi:hypothetical protein